MATTQINHDDVVSVDREEMCDYGLMKSYYTHLKRVLDREVKTANFFVERVHRAPWNLCDQYVSSIIEVRMIVFGKKQKKTRMILNQSIYLDSSVLFREAFGEMYMFLPSKVVVMRYGHW